MPDDAAQAGGEFGAVFFMMQYTGTTDAATGTSFFCAGTIDIVMRTGHGGYGLVRLSAPNLCKDTTSFADMQFFLHICSKNDLWLYPQAFEHSINTAFLLVKVGMDVEVEGCGDISVA